ncbi:MAG: zinc ribbon domain-containing protein [Oscillospiraceae bacterium]
MRCSKCGTETESKFCPECGTPIDQITTEVENVQTIKKPFWDKPKIAATVFTVIYMIFGLTNGKNENVSLVTTLGIAVVMWLIFWGISNAVAKNMKMNNLNTAEKNAYDTIKDKAKRQERLDRIKELEDKGEIYCPKCLSTHYSTNKKGFGIGKAVVGAALTGGIGLTAGNLGAKKVRVTCLKCGYQWMAGKK